MSKQRNTKRRKYLRAAERTTNVFRDLVASKWTATKQRQHDDRKLGQLGAASLVRVIMKDGKPAKEVS